MYMSVPITMRSLREKPRLLTNCAQLPIVDIEDVFRNRHDSVKKLTPLSNQLSNRNTERYTNIHLLSLSNKTNLEGRPGSTY